MAMQEAVFPAAVAPKQSSTGLFVMTALLLGFGFWVIYPIVLTLVISFNAAPLGRDPVWTLSNWVTAWTDPGAFLSLWNTILIYLCTTVIGFPIAIIVSWALARTKVMIQPWSGIYVLDIVHAADHLHHRRLDLSARPR